MSESTKRARMHTAEHVLSAVMRIHYGAPRNIELHLGDKKTKCDYLPEQQLAEVDIKKIEQLVNDELSKNHTVSSFFFSVAKPGIMIYGKYQQMQKPSASTKLAILMHNHVPAHMFRILQMLVAFIF